MSIGVTLPGHARWDAARSSSDAGKLTRQGNSVKKKTERNGKILSSSWGRGADAGRLLPTAIGDAPAGQVIWRNLHLHPVAGDYADEVLAHLAGDVRDYLAADVEFHPKLRIGEGLLD